MGKAERTSGERAAPEPLISAPAAPTNASRQRPAGGGPQPHATPAATRSGKGFRTLLRNRAFLRLWIAQLISQTIMNAANYGMIVLIATQSESVFATGGAIAAFSLSAALFGAPAGVLVDRFDKRRVLWVSNVLRGLATFGFVVSLFIDSKALLPVYLLTFCIALVGQFFAPAEGAVIPLLVHEDELVNALALFNITFTLSQALGIIIMGPVIMAGMPALHLGTLAHRPIVVQPIHSLFLLVSTLFFVCALLIVSIPHRLMRNRVGQEQARPLAHEGERLRGIWQGIVECWRFIRTRPALLAAVLQLSLTGIVVAVIAEIGPSFVQDFFDLPPTFAALVFIPAGVGLILGAAGLPHVLKRARRRSDLVTLGVVTLAMAMALLTAVHLIAGSRWHATWWQADLYIGVVVLLIFVIGLALDLVNIPAQTTMQERSPDYIRGRVLALQMMLFNAATVPVVFLIGLAADMLGLPAAMDVLALGIVGAGAATLFYGARPGVASDTRPLPAAPSGSETAGRPAGQSASGPLARDVPWGRARPIQPHEERGPRAPGASAGRTTRRAGRRWSKGR
jgi:MFS family permease